MLRSKNKFLSFFSNLKGSEKIIFILINVCLIIDVAICTSPEFIPEQVKSSFSFVLFNLITIVIIIGQMYLQKFAEKDNKLLLTKSKYLNYLSKITKISCFVLTANLIFVTGSMIILNEYFIINLLIANNISCFVGSFFLGSLGLRFIIWFSLKRDSYVLLFYGMGLIFLFLSFFTIFLSDNFLIIAKPLSINANLEITYPEIENNIFDIINNSYIFLRTASYVMMLMGTFVLLSYYSNKTQKIKLLCALVIVFIIYFLSSLDAFQIMEISIYDEELFVYYIFQSLITTVGGVIFGYSFLKVASKLEVDNPIKKLLIITGFGFILIYTVNQTTVIATAYPPYGLPTLSFIVISVYLLCFGIYSSAISLSNTIVLRNKIRLLTKNNSNLFSSMGEAQVTSQLQNAVKAVKTIVEEEEEKLKEKTGLEVNFTEDKVQDYMQQVVQEMLKRKSLSKNTS
jgi:hypothetical protein